MFILLLLALLLRLPPMTRGFEYDELWSVIDFIEAENLWRTVSTYNQFNNHIFYSILARFCEGFLGRTEWVLRLPALLLGLATIPTLWLSARHYFGTVVGLFSAFAIATSAVHIGFSTSARGYTGLVFFTLMSSVLFLRWLSGGATRRLIVTYVIVSVLGVYTHLYTIMVVGVQAATLLVIATRELRSKPTGGLMADRFREIWLAISVVGAISFLCYIPTSRGLVSALIHGKASTFQPLLPLNVMMYLTGTGGWQAGLLTVTAIAGWILCARRYRIETLYVGLLFLLPLLAVWVTRPEFVRGRFFLFLLPAYAVGLVFFVEVFAHAFRGRYARTVQIAAVVFSIVLVWSWASRPWSNVLLGGFREAAKAMEAPSNSRVGTCAIGIGNRFYDWYTASPVFVPKTVEEFETFAASHEEVRCAYMSSYNELGSHTKIGRLIRAGSPHPERFFVIDVYRYKP
jgi:hypothetical protein